MRLLLALFCLLLPHAAVAEPPRRLPASAGIPTVSRPPTVLHPQAPAPGTSCRAAIAAAERAHAIPAGLLLAIGLVESGRTNPATGQRDPWPWAVNAEGRGALPDTRAAALALVRQAEAAGIRSIDIGCMQVNRLHHPAAFATLEQGFDPMANADYAARFLRQLKEGPAGGDWMTAAGFYHSQTPDRAEAYRGRVQAAMGGPPRAAPPVPPPAPAAVAGGGGQRLGNGANQAALLAPPPSGGGRGLDAYRARPVRLALVATGLRRSATAGPQAVAAW
jgi:hypothetical protein